MQQVAPPGASPHPEGRAAEPPPRLTFAGGRVGVADPASFLRALAVAVCWLGPPLWLARRLGRAEARDALHRVERLWARSLCRALGIRLAAEGLERIDPGERYVVAALHEGMADVLALLQLPLPLRFVARDEIFDWPALGPYLRDSGQILVRPEHGARSYRGLLRDASAALGRGEIVVIFPQGSILGVETAFQRGAFTLARALGRPILPVALTGSHRVWEHPYTPRLRFDQPISMRVLAPIAAAEVAHSDPAELCAAVQRLLKAAALGGGMAAPRRFVPARDGYWDGYAYAIDPAFPELAAEVARHRAQVAGAG